MRYDSPAPTSNQESDESRIIGGEEQFTYLGSVVNKTDGSDDGINARSRICKVRKVFAKLKPVWKSNVRNENTNITVINTKVKSDYSYL